MEQIQNTLAGLVSRAIKKTWPDAQAPVIVQFTKELKFGDLQCNTALALAKLVGSNPRETAQKIIDAIAPNDYIEKTEIAGPGFINFFLKESAINNYLLELGQNKIDIPELDKSGDVIVDYSSPNIAKRMHIGHLRSTIIGDSIKRCYQFLGFHTVADNHLGDWGTQFGKLIVAFDRWLDQAAFDAEPVEELERLYVLFEQKSADNPELLPLARAELKKLQDGDERNNALWQKFIDVSLAEYGRVYSRLGVTFDTYYGESHYNSIMPSIIEDLTVKGIAEESEGALIVKFEENEHLHPCLIRKADGAYLYATSDLACIKFRRSNYKINRLVYVTDNRQIDHFRQVFKVAERLGWTDKKDHVEFGIMKFAEGHFSSRKGNVIYLHALLDEAQKRAYDVVTEKNPELPEEQRREIARVVGLGAVKYSDLSQNRSSDIIFDWNSMLSFEGNTAPYLQYTYARIRSILRKSGRDGQDVPSKLILSNDEEKALARQMMLFPQAVIRSAETYKPNTVADFVYELAGTYNTFQNKHRVLQAESEELIASRLFLCAKTAQLIKIGLNLLGIETVEQM